MDENEFIEMAEHLLDRWLDRLENADEFCDITLSDGVLTAITQSGAVFILNQHQPLQQIWLSSAVSGAHHYAFNDFTADWLDTRDGRSLDSQLSADLATLNIEIDLHI